MLNILSWNIRQGGGTRVLQQCRVLSEYGAEIIALSEFRNNDSGVQIRRLLMMAGYRYQHVSSAPNSTNSVGIFSKIPGSMHHHMSADSEYNHNILSMEFEAFRLYGMYLPHKKKHVLFDYLLSEIEHEVPAILVGDFNTGINHVDQKGNSFWYTDKMAALGKKNYVDAFRHMHGNVAEYSWYSHQGNGYRYDHTYIHNNLVPIIKKCDYLHSWREEGLSDHSPMVLTLG